MPWHYWLKQKLGHSLTGACGAMRYNNCLQYHDGSWLTLKTMDAVELLELT